MGKARCCLAHTRLQAAERSHCEFMPRPLAPSYIIIQTKRWEYHLPKEGTLAHSFGTLVIAGPIHEHYKYSKPSETIRCTVKENPLHLFLPNVPSSVQELLQKDIPLTQLQVTLFDDASLVGLSIPHILCDGYGVKAIIQSLTHVLNGGVPPPPPTLADPFQSYANAPQPLEAPPYWRVLSSIQTAVLILFSLWRSIWERPIENRDVFFPKDAVAQIKSEAMSDLKKEHGESSDVWISSSDALLAFCLKVRKRLDMWLITYHRLKSAPTPRPNPALHSTYSTLQTFENSWHRKFQRTLYRMPSAWLSHRHFPSPHYPICRWAHWPCSSEELLNLRQPQQRSIVGSSGISEQPVLQGYSLNQVAPFTS